MKNYKYVLLDWDGCLAKTLQIHLKAYKQTFAEYGIEPSDFDITKKVFGDWNGPAKLGIEDVDGFTEKYLHRVDQHFADAELYQDARQVVETLSKSKSLALVTTSTRRWIESALEKTGMRDLFLVVLAKEDVSQHKPDPEIVESAIKFLKGNKEESIIVGDSKSDLGAAQNAGIDSVFFSPRDHDAFYDSKDLIEKYKPTFVIEKHEQLLDILL